MISCLAVERVLQKMVLTCPEGATRDGGVKNIEHVFGDNAFGVVVDA